MITDKDRIDWLESSNRLELVSDGSTWEKGGEKFISPFRLAANQTQFSPGKSLREIIDSAIRLTKQTDRE